MRELNIENWNRKQQYHFFNQFDDPYFAVTVDFDVTNTYKYSKNIGISFFALYLHACMKAINSVENFKYRIQDGKVIIHDVIHASPTILRDDNTFGCSFIHFDESFDQFYRNFEAEKTRILNSTDLFPEQTTEDCIYCSALPWFNFSGHKEPLFGVKKESVPKLAFGKYVKNEEKLIMPVAIAVNHALVDGYHVGLFAKKFQELLDNI
ncbi:MAG: chloramphenicol acetyltransferase [Flavobacteriaceae bacterium]|nr:chloramphenicol acetyltransferase [Flavobacteriaceae bacterium]